LVLSHLAFTHDKKPKAEKYRTFASPNGRFQIVVYRIPNLDFMPGQSSDAPGYFQLCETATGKILRERPVEMVQLVDDVVWSPRSVNIRLLADWELTP
jgi:hypothetical protein